MPRTCTICRSEYRQAIDAAIVAHAPKRRIAAEYVVSEAAVRRHAAGHLPARLAKAKEAEEAASADTLLAQVKSLQERALTILDAAEKASDFKAAVAAIREARGNLELLAKLLGQIEAAKPGDSQFKQFADALADYSDSLTPKEREARIDELIAKREARKTSGLTHEQALKELE